MKAKELIGTSGFIGLMSMMVIYYMFVDVKITLIATLINMLVWVMYYSILHVLKIDKAIERWIEHE